MERRNSYSRSVNVPTAAERIADARNKRETLLLAETSKWFSSKTDGTIRTFYREKAKANNFLQKVRRRSSGILMAKSDEHEEVEAERKIGFITENETRNATKDQKARRPSLKDLNQTDKMQKRIQEFLTQDFPGSQSKNEQEGQLNEENIKDELGQKEINPLVAESSEDHTKTNAALKTPFKVRSRTSGICFSHSPCQRLHLPPINLPDISRTCSVAEFRRNSFSNFSKSRCGKIRTPIMVGQLSLEGQRLMTSMPLINPPRGTINERSRGLTW